MVDDLWPYLITDDLWWFLIYHGENPSNPILPVACDRLKFCLNNKITQTRNVGSPVVRWLKSSRHETKSSGCFSCYPVDYEILSGSPNSGPGLTKAGLSGVSCFCKIFGPTSGCVGPNQSTPSIWDQSHSHWQPLARWPFPPFQTIKYHQYGWRQGRFIYPLCLGCCWTSMAVS